jgi:hypothetical protein
MFTLREKTKMIESGRALRGRDRETPVAERIFWEAPGVDTTAAGYPGGYTPNPDLRGSVQRLRAAGYPHGS